MRVTTPATFIRTNSKKSRRLRVTWHLLFDVTSPHTVCGMPVNGDEDHWTKEEHPEWILKTMGEVREESGFGTCSNCTGALLTNDVVRDRRHSTSRGWTNLNTEV